MLRKQVSGNTKLPATNLTLGNQGFTLKETERGKYYTPIGCTAGVSREIAHTMEQVDDVLTKLAELYPDSKLNQTIVFCESAFYKERFIAKLHRMGSDPAPWVGWSEGDEDDLETPNGHVNAIFIKIGAEFSCVSDQRRFYGHELDHPLQTEISPMLTTIGKNKNEYLLLDMEGVAEADQRIGLGLQARRDMQMSTKFIAELPLDKLAKPADILIDGYDHASFIADTVSRNPGYAYCFLWMYEMTAEISEQLGLKGNLQQKYLDARNSILNSYHRTTSLAGYKALLKETTNFDYDTEAQNPDFMKKAQKRFWREFHSI